MATNRLLLDGKKEIVSKRSLLLFHWFVCSVGLTGIIYGISWKLHAFLSLGRQGTQYNEWAVSFFFPDKPQQLILLIGGSISLFLYYLLIYLVMRRQDERLTTAYNLTEYWSSHFILLYVALPISINSIVYAWFRSRNNPFVSLSSLLLCILWFWLLSLPFWKSLYHWNSCRQVIEAMNHRVREKTWLYAVGALLCLVFIQLFTIFLPYMRGELLMINEYMDLPEYTLLEGQYVSNTEYINNHNLGGLLKYDPDADAGNAPLPRNGTFVKIPRTEHLDGFIEKHNTKYSYNSTLNALVIHGVMSPEESNELGIAFESVEDKFKVMSLDPRSRSQQEQLVKKTYTPEEKEFLEKNKFEMNMQVLNRWVIHHHNFVLGAINEYALDKPLEAINTQYGLFNVILMKHLLEKTGGISYQNYFQKWYSFWLLYYALFLLLSFLLFGNIYYVTLVCVLAFGFVITIDYKFLFVAPGYNPVRHFFDIPVIALLYLYLKRRHAGLLALGFVLGLVAILINKEFGLFIVVALSVTILVKTFQERGTALVREVGWVTTAVAIAGVILVAGRLGGNTMKPYYLEGFASFPVDVNRSILMILTASGCYLILLQLTRVTSALKYVALFLLVYSQELFVYYIWSGHHRHLLSIAPILVLGAGVFGKLIIDLSPVKRFERLLIGSLIAVALIAVYIPGLFAYYSTKQEYERIFVDHKTYDWNFEAAKFKSTMNPKYFLDSVSLIQEYATSENAIHIISKYDNILPFLARKYSAMPFPDLQWFILTDKEESLCIENIKTQKPEYLFVDSDIERNLNGEIVLAELPSVSGPAGESLMRVHRLNELKKIFHAVKDDYRAVQRGLLLTVYERKSNK